MYGIQAGRLMVTAGLCLALLIAGCGGSKSAQDTSTTTAPPGAEGTERPRRAGTIACRLHSCSPPYFCNEESGVCEMLPCKTKKDCPYDYKCDLARNVCR
ncbi:MAG: hypothetical protein OES69_04705 [Myxococcales bacterium]|nr:hypothetical protein [Myxococcales bacterium]MDH3843214.1 hypothetical protein [Myxococcales bacterium]